MRNQLIGAAAVAMLLGGAALAQSTDVQNPNSESSVQSAPSQNQGCGQMSTNQGIGGTGQYETPPPAQEPPTYTPPAETPSYTTPPQTEATDQTNQEKERNNKMRGVMVTAGAGAEGYTGSLAPAIRTGFGWGVTAAIKPTKVFGLELGYSGAMNRLNVSSGNLVRNGAHAAATLALGAAPVQPYVLGGIAYNRYSGSFISGNSGSVPLGVGVRAHMGRFTADLRGAYNVLLTSGLGATGGGFGTGRWDGTLNLGGTF